MKNTAIFILLGLGYTVMIPLYLAITFVILLEKWYRWCVANIPSVVNL